MSHIVIISNEHYSGLNPIHFGYEDCKKGHFFGPAVRQYWLIHFVVSGFGIFRTNGKEYRVNQGEMFVIPPYEETYYEADKDNPWSYIWIGFTVTDGLPTDLPEVIKCPGALTVFNSMKDCEALSHGRSAYLTAKLWELFSLIAEGEKKQNDYIKNALDCINTDYMYGITVDEIAKRIHLDRTYFSVLFKKKMGITPKRYLQNHRMSIAASLIVNKNISISVAAYSVGYSDVFTFSKVFKQHFGLSPTQYVKQTKEKSL